MNTDFGLLAAARKMDRDALIKIFDLYSGALYNYALRLCGDPLTADFIVGDVFAKLLEKFSSGNGPNSNLRSYLYETAYHLVVDDSREFHRYASLETENPPDTNGYVAYANVEDRMAFDRVMFAIRHDLTRDQRHVIILRFLEGFSLRETASIIGKEVSNVKVIQNRAMATLRKALEYVAV